MNANKIINLAWEMYAAEEFEYCKKLLQIHIAENKTDVNSRLLLARCNLAMGSFDLSLIEAKSAFLMAETLGVDDIGDLEQSRSELQEMFAKAAHEENSRQQMAAVLHAQTTPRPKSIEGHTWESEEEKFQIHRAFAPYFGFPEKGHLFNNNNYGFSYEVGKPYIDYPYIPEDEEFIVGVFGGSVASQFYKDTVDYIENTLTAHPDLTGRKVKVLQFGMGAGKQPIQLIYLIYFAAIGQKLDLVVNLDGFNDCRNAIINEEMGHYHIMPWALISTSLDALVNIPDLNEEYLSYYQEVVRIKNKIRDIEKGGSGLFGKLSSLENLKQKENTLAQNPPKSEGATSTMELIRVNPIKFLALDSASRDKLVGEVVGVWQNCASFMNVVCRQFGAIYIHAIQPNHFHCNKPLTELEKAWMILSPKEHTLLRTSRAIIEACYPRMIEFTGKLAADGASICDMIDVFDTVEEQIFSDADCHFNEYGYLLMAERLCEHILTMNLKIRD